MHTQREGNKLKHTQTKDVRAYREACLKSHGDGDKERNQNKARGGECFNTTHLYVPSWQQDAAVCFLKKGGEKKQNLCTAFKNNKNKRETSKSILPLGLSQLEWIRCLIWEAAFAKLQMIW